MLFWGKGGSRRIAGLDAPRPARGQGLQPYGALDYFGWRAEGVQGASGKPPACIIGNNVAVSNSPWRGMTRRLRRGERACSPMGRSHFSFGGERKVCKRKPAARRLREKALYAHFGGGARYVARIIVGQLTHAIVRARSSPFSAVKMGGPFSLRCLSPLCSPAVGVGQAYPLQSGMLRHSLTVLQLK